MPTFHMEGAQCYEIPNDGPDPGCACAGYCWRGAVCWSGAIRTACSRTAELRISTTVLAILYGCYELIELRNIE